MCTSYDAIAPRPSRRAAFMTAQASAYTHLTFAALVREVRNLAASYPHLAVAWTAQERYGLATAGQCGRTACEVWVLELTHRASLERHPERPDVLVSGALHGDERVGPLVTLELARWLLHRYDTDPWARRLVHTRRLLLVPAANANGYYMRSRFEVDHDPNRDFPFQQEPRACMTTVAARALNEVFRAHLVQLALTYHAGMEAVGYVWGDFAHRRDRAAANRSPDEIGISALARAAVRCAGAGPRGRFYPAAAMNSIVYPVAGGMEDWAYAASWEPHHVRACEPRTHGGYDAVRTRQYANASARAVVLLIETSDEKSPPASSMHGQPASSLSTDAWPTVELAQPAGAASTRLPNGFVARNVRLALASIDLARPFVQLDSDDAAVDSGGCLRVRWRVWGAVRVDATAVVWREVQSGEWQPVADSHEQSGPAVWAETGGASAPSWPLSHDRGVFTACVRLPPAAATSDSAPPPRRSVLIAAAATVDQSWGRPSPQPVTPRSAGPQSHLVRARTDPSWHQRANGREVRGQTRWLSDVAIEVECEADGSLAPGAMPRTRSLTPDGGVRGGGWARTTRRRGH